MNRKLYEVNHVLNKYLNEHENATGERLMADDKMQEVEDALSGDADTQEIPQEVLDAVQSINAEVLAENRTKPTPAVLAEHEENLKEAEGKELRPNVVVPKDGVTFEDFKCYRDKTYGMWHIKRAVPGGSTPAKLSGSYTELANAHRAITEYVYKVNQR